MQIDDAASLRPREAAAFLGIGQSTLWRWMKEMPDFPKPIRMGARMTVLRRDQLKAWRDAQAEGPQ